MQGFAHGTLVIDDNRIVSCSNRNFPFKERGHLLAYARFNTFIKENAISDTQSGLEKLTEELIGLKTDKQVPITKEMHDIIDDIIPRLVNLATNNDLTIERLEKFKQMSEKEMNNSDDLDCFIAGCLHMISTMKKLSKDAIWQDVVKKIRANRANYVASWGTQDPKIIKRAIEASESNPINPEQMLFGQLRERFPAF